MCHISCMLIHTPPKKKNQLMFQICLILWIQIKQVNLAFFYSSFLPQLLSSEVNAIPYLILLASFLVLHGKVCQQPADYCGFPEGCAWFPPKLLLVTLTSGEYKLFVEMRSSHKSSLRSVAFGDYPLNVVCTSVWEICLFIHSIFVILGTQEYFT